jgi:DNA helicase-2/ATP-dependent DNA helicase PcrA
VEYDTPSRFIRDIDPSLLRLDSAKEVPEQDYGTKRLPWTQNPRPVASQFKADPMPRQVAPRRAEAPVDPFSEGFKRKLVGESGGRFKPVRAQAPSSAVDSSSLREGAVIEHQRFGIGTVVKVEGSGENEKATVQFRNLGTKQLLLKFAKFKVVS